MRRTPKHHPGEDLLVGYATGTLPASLELLTATHLVFCPSCRRDVAALEELAGAQLFELPPDAPRPMGPAVLAAMAEAPSSLPMPGAESTLPELARLPRLLRDRIPADARWTGWAPGFREIPLISGDGPAARLVRIAPGAVVPLHTHEGEERTLVLAGELTDSDPLRSGDLAVRDGSVRHTHVVTGDDPCLCLVANDAPLVQLTARGRLFRWISDRIG